jgi:hypothetical protein
LASKRTHASPIPDAPPVTIALVPLRSIGQDYATTSVVAKPSDPRYFVL